MIEKFIEPEFLSDNCHHADMQDVRHDFTKEEMAVLKDQALQVSIEKSRRDKLKAKFKDLIDNHPHEHVISQLSTLNIQSMGAQGMKGQKKLFAELLKKISDKYEIRNQQVYGFDHQEEGKMAFYSEDGHFLYDRGLTQSERQLNINSLLKKAE